MDFSGIGTPSLGRSVRNTQNKPKTFQFLDVSSSDANEDA